MGCNESKSSGVAADNTTTARRRTPLLRKSFKRTNTINNINNNKKSNPSVVESISETNHADVDVKGSPSTSTKGRDPASTDKISLPGVHAEVKEVVANNDAEEKRKEEEERVVVGGATTTITTLKKAAGKLVSKESPEERYFSSRKDEDGVESVVTEEGYYSPNHESMKDVDTREENGESEEPEQKLEVKEEEKLKGGLVEEKTTTEVAGEEKLEVDQSRVEPEVIFKEVEVTLPSAEANESTEIEDKEAIVVTDEAPSITLQAKEQGA